MEAHLGGFANKLRCVGWRALILSAILLTLNLFTSPSSPLPLGPRLRLQLCRDLERQHGCLHPGHSGFQYPTVVRRHAPFDRPLRRQLAPAADGSAAADVPTSSADGRQLLPALPSSERIRTAPPAARPEDDATPSPARTAPDGLPSAASAADEAPPSSATEREEQDRLLGGRKGRRGPARSSLDVLLSSIFHSPCPALASPNLALQLCNSVALHSTLTPLNDVPHTPTSPYSDPQNAPFSDLSARMYSSPPLPP